MSFSSMPFCYNIDDMPQELLLLISIRLWQNWFHYMLFCLYVTESIDDVK